MACRALNKFGGIGIAGRKVECSGLWFRVWGVWFGEPQSCIYGEPGIHNPLNKHYNGDPDAAALEENGEGIDEGPSSIEASLPICSIPAGI